MNNDFEVEITFNFIEIWLKYVGVKHYLIQENFIVDVYGDVDLSKQNIKQIPIQFGKVHGSFYCNAAQLTTLLGVPRVVEKDFCCEDNPLTSSAYNYLPKKVAHTLICDNYIALEKLLYTDIGFEFKHLCYKEEDVIDSFKAYYSSGDSFFYLKLNATLFRKLTGYYKQIVDEKYRLNNVISDEINYKKNNKIKL